ALVVEAHVPDVVACKCAPFAWQIVLPDRAPNAPLNTKVRVRGPAQETARLVLRNHEARGADVALKERRLSTDPDDRFVLVELTPEKALEPNARYEVALLDRSTHPPFTVFGTFRTGTKRDVTAPRLEKIGRVVAYRTPQDKPRP